MDSCTHVQRPSSPACNKLLSLLELFPRNCHFQLSPGASGKQQQPFVCKPGKVEESAGLQHCSSWPSELSLNLSILNKHLALIADFIVAQYLCHNWWTLFAVEFYGSALLQCLCNWICHSSRVARRCLAPSSAGMPSWGMAWGTPASDHGTTGYPEVQGTPRIIESNS